MKHALGSIFIPTYSSLYQYNTHNPIMFNIVQSYPVLSINTQHYHLQSSNIPLYPPMAHVIPLHLPLLINIQHFPLVLSISPQYPTLFLST